MEKDNNQNRSRLSKIFLWFIFQIVFILLFISYALAASFNISLDKTKITLDEQIEITLTASGGKPSDPDIPVSQDYEISYRGSSTQVQIVNGNMSESQTYTYILIPKNPGTFTIGPIKTTMDGQEYSTRPVTIEIANQIHRRSIYGQNNGTGNSNGNQSGNTNNGSQQAKPQKSAPKSADLFVTAQVNNLHPYTDQQVVYSFRFYRKVATGNNEIKYPDFKGFWVEQSDKKGREFEQMINGERYVVTEVKKALYATSPGNITIRGTTFVVEYLYKEDDGFSGIFSTTRSELKRFATNPIRLSVKPLPVKPADFSGLVSSQVSLSGKLSQNEARVGDSVTLNLTMTGKGNINDVKNPGLKLKNDFKVYEDKPVTTTDFQVEGIVSEKVFKYALVPLKAGNIKIPPLKITYFNPKDRKYEYLTTSPFNLKVGPSEDGSQPNLPQENKKNDVKILGEDIFTIHEELDSLKQQGLTFNKKILYTLWFLIPLLLYILSLVFNPEKVKQLQQAKSNGRKNYKNYLARINELENNIDKNSAEVPEKLTAIFKDYLTTKFNLNSQSINPESIVRQIPRTEISPAVIKEISDLFEKFEFLKFSGKSVSNDKKKEILNAARELLNRLELVKK